MQASLNFLPIVGLFPTNSVNIGTLSNVLSFPQELMMGCITSRRFYGLAGSCLALTVQSLAISLNLSDEYSFSEVDHGNPEYNNY